MASSTQHVVCSLAIPVLVAPMLCCCGCEIPPPAPPPQPESIASESQPPVSVEKAQVHDIVQATSTKLQEISSEHELLISNALATIKTIDQELKKAEASSQMIVLLAKKIETIERINNEQAKQRGGLLNAKYSSGAKLLKEMGGAVSTVILVQDALMVERLLARSTSLWSDEDFKNTYDSIRGIGTPIGLLIGAVGGIVVAANPNSKDATTGGAISLGVGAGVAGLAQIFGLTLGEEDGNKLKRKAQFIDLSRNAYSDLSARIDALKVQQKIAQNLETDLEAFEVRYNNLQFTLSNEQPEGPKQDELKKHALNELASRVERFIKVVSSVGEILNSYAVLIDKYKGNNSDPKILSDMSELSKIVSIARDRFQKKAEPFLSRRDDVTRLFGTAQ